MARLLLDGTAGAERLWAAPASVPELDASRGAGAARARGRSSERRDLARIAEQLPAIVLRNPLSSEQEALRLTLMVGLLTTLRENSKHSDAGLWFFELGRRYLPTPGLTEGTELADERRSLGVALLGPVTHHWHSEPPAADFYDLKGVAETLLQALGIAAYRFVPVQHPSCHPGR